MIRIDDTIKNITTNFNVGVITCKVKIKDDVRIDEIIEKCENKIHSTIDIKDVVNLPIIKEARDSYKAYGKDPSRYRLAVESLYRRLSKGNKLYRINNVVDLGNILSIETKKSIAVLDSDKIIGDVLIRLGQKDEEYFGIGRGRINIENIPVYEDDVSLFGSSTSDTERTMITASTKSILLLIISFTGKDDLQAEINYAKELYTEYADAYEFTSKII